MSMMIVSAFVRTPIGGWNPFKRWDKIGRENYDDLDGVLRDFESDGLDGGFIIQKQWPKRQVGNCTVYGFELKTAYQQEHPECNQAECEAEITVWEADICDNQKHNEPMATFGRVEWSRADVVLAFQNSREGIDPTDGQIEKAIEKINESALRDAMCEVGWSFLDEAVEQVLSEEAR